MATKKLITVLVIVEQNVKRKKLYGIQSDSEQRTRKSDFEYLKKLLSMIKLNNSKLIVITLIPYKSIHNSPLLS